MASGDFKAKAYIKEGCPFSFKFLLFMTEAGLLDRIEIIRMDPKDPSFEPTKRRLSEGLGKPATFPTVEIEPGRFMNDSERLIDHFAARENVRPDALPILSFYKETLFPQLEKLHASE
ncbi:MAG TPA: glutathione S-transferase N-terminal domain-containing protein [Gammaproteobacteria bacterium]